MHEKVEKATPVVPVTQENLLEQVAVVREGIKKLAEPFDLIRELIPTLETIKGLYHNWFRLEAMSAEFHKPTPSVSVSPANENQDDTGVAGKDSDSTPEAGA